MTTSKPATPLPWELHGRRPRNVWAIEQNAEYVCHACNAYPHSIELLKAALVIIRGSRTGDSIEAFLRELGEL